jgi:hypothetical protein
MMAVRIYVDARYQAAPPAPLEKREATEPTMC